MAVTVAEFCLALHRVCIHGDRDEQGWLGEALWASLEVAEQKHGSEEVELPTTLEPTTLERVILLAGGVGVDTSVLGQALTRVPDWYRVLHDWRTGEERSYYHEWWGIK